MMIYFCSDQKIHSSASMINNVQSRSELSDFILYVIVDVGFGLRFSSSDGNRKLRNLKVAATKLFNLVRIH
jgi:hypothetical protein